MMRKILLITILIIIFISLVVSNIIFYKNNFSRIENKFCILHNDIKSVEYWGIYRDKNNLIGLEQKIKNEKEARQLFNLNFQKEILSIKLNNSQDIFVNSIKNTINSVVQIKNLTMQWQGSGVAWSEDILVTARHVVEHGTNFEITLNDGTIVKATEAISSKKYDIGFIKLNEKVLTPAKFGSVKQTVLGQQIYIIGSPYGKLNFNSVTLGIVSGLNRDFDYLNTQIGKDYGWSIAFTTDSAGYPGNSGCPVFTLDGKVRGILVGGFADNLIICIPSDIFLNKLEVIEMMFSQNKYSFEKEIYILNNSYHSGL